MGGARGVDADVRRERGKPGVGGLSQRDGARGGNTERSARTLASVLDESIRVLFSRVTGGREGSLPLTDEALLAMVRAELRRCR
ncbi:MAG: hypothetical protein PHX87_06195 [Candidatus Peribacteraceae bacterium]|nr:hypothetical protein [Candidatus Peribacteraceae bacterium]MDD5742981.1 hypothetical protein [Candidatus Peribacteraceae bacterium]